MENTVISNSIKDIEVGKKIGISDEEEKVDIELEKKLVHIIDDEEYTYEYLENSGNIVIEENVEKEITLKYIRNIYDSANTANSNVKTSDINILLYIIIFFVAVIGLIVGINFVSKNRFV